MLKIPNFKKFWQKVLEKINILKYLILTKKKNYLEDYNLVLNTDGNNPLTKKYFSKKIEKKYNSVAYTTILKHKKITNNVATQIFTKYGPLAFLPISECETSVVYSINNHLTFLLIRNQT